MSITPEQLVALQAKVNKLVADSGTAAQAKSDSDAAHAALAAANAGAVAADTAETVANGVVNGDVTDLQGFVVGLAPAPPVTPAA